MTEELKKKFDRDIRLSYNLNFIKQCCEVASMYLNGDYEINDLEELIFDLHNIEDNVREIEELIEEIALEYEQEIEVLRNEQL